MATIRAAMIAAAAFAFWHASAPAQAQSRQTTAGAPLQLVPGAGQAARTTASRNRAKAATRSGEKPAKKAVKAKSTPGPAATRTARPATKKNIRPTPTAQRQNGGHRVRSVRNRPAQTAIAAAVPEVREQEKSAPLAFAPGPGQELARVRAPGNATAKDRAQPPRASAPDDNVMRDGSSISLVGRLPWWRNDALQPIRYGSGEAESQVMAAADAWLQANAKADTDAVLAGGEERILVASAQEFNALDRAADPVASVASVPAPPSSTFWHSLIAILGGAIAAAAVAAASTRFIPA
jgi:hypothetical protein